MVITAHQVRSYGPLVTEHDAPPIYEIRFRGRLGSHWAAWFDGMSVRSTEHGTTVIWGPVVDQAALHGFLQKLRDLGVVLESVVQITHDTPGATQ